MHFCQVSEQYKGVNFVERHEKNRPVLAEKKKKSGASGNSGGTALQAGRLTHTSG